MCHAEFPWVILNGDHLFMVFAGTEGTPANIVELCTPPSCATNFVMEVLLADLGSNTRAPLLATVVRATDALIAGTTLNGVFLTGPNGSGIAAGYYGDCSHLSVNTAQQVACSFRTNVVPSGGPVAESRAAVFPLSRSMHDDNNVWEKGKNTEDFMRNARRLVLFFGLVALVTGLSPAAKADGPVA